MWINVVPSLPPSLLSDHSTDVGQIVDRANKAIAISHCQTTLSRCG